MRALGYNRGMTIWIEYAFLENFIVDVTLLYLTAKILKLKFILWRQALAGILGGTLALLFPLLPLPEAALLPVRFLSGGILPTIALPVKDGKTRLFSLFFFYLCTFCYGGFLTAVYQLFEIYPFSLQAFVLSWLPFFLLIVEHCMRKFIIKVRERKLIFECEVYYQGNEVTVKGLLDTGNELTFKGNPVCLLDRNVAREIAAQAEDYMIIHTAAGESIAEIFRAEIRIYSEAEGNIIKGVYFAVSPVPLGGKFGIVLQPLLLKEEKDAERTVAETIFATKEKRRREKGYGQRNSLHQR